MSSSAELHGLLNRVADAAVAADDALREGRVADLEAAIGHLVANCEAARVAAGVIVARGK